MKEICRHCGRPITYDMSYNSSGLWFHDDDFGWFCDAARDYKRVAEPNPQVEVEGHSTNRDSTLVSDRKGGKTTKSLCL